MTGRSPIQLALPDVLATEALGCALARTLPADSGALVLYLHGELGSGKTTSVRSLLQALGVERTVRSPTYTLIEVYEPKGRVCVHVDLYRLQGPLDVEALGLRDYLDHCVLLVEWPEKGGAALPPPDLDLTLTYAGEARRARLDASTARGCQWLADLLNDASFGAYVSNLT